MACNCREEIEKMLREELQDPLAKMRGMICFVGGKVQFKPTVPILYRKKKKDGSYNKSETEMELSYGYCPFCGTKFDDESDNLKNETNK